MSRTAPVLVAAALLLVLALPVVQADHSTSTCSDVELHLLGPWDGCTLNGLDFDPDDPRDTVVFSTLPDGATFSGKIEVILENDSAKERVWVGMIGGAILESGALGDYPTEDVTVTVNILPYNGMHATGTWEVTINHHQP